MDISKQCCNLEQAKLLKSLGVIQESVFYFHPSYVGIIIKGTNVTKTGTQHKRVSVSNDKASTSAFTVAELCVMLPNYYPSWRFEVVKGGTEVKWIATIIAGPNPPSPDDIHTLHEFDRYGKTQAEALATLLIALLETGAITAEEVNQRLLSK